jgi:hypothetical protein
MHTMQTDWETSRNIIRRAQVHDPMRRKTSVMACGITTPFLLLLGVITGTVAAQLSTKPQNTSTPLPQAGSPMVELVTQATEATKLLRTWSAQVVSSLAIDTIHRGYPKSTGRSLWNSRQLAPCCRGSRLLSYGCCTEGCEP